MLEFADANADEVLEAFRKYHATAELSDVTDPNLVYSLRTKLDATGHYDYFEVERVIAAELKPGATQADVLAAVQVVYRVGRAQRDEHPRIKVGGGAGWAP